ncbi:MAG: radical SAM protein [bacterium]|nr:radical SAM protein [bacterium]
MKHYLLEFTTAIILQTVKNCNLHCKHCYINDFGKTIPNGVRHIMPFDEFTKIIARLEKLIAGINEFYFSSFEPLLHKYIFHMMDYLLEINPHLQFPMVTNTMIIDDEKLQKLKKYPIPSYTISLDGMTKEIVESFKIGVNFDHLIWAIKKLSSLNKNTFVGTVFVLHNKNIYELWDYADFVNELGVKKIMINNLMTFSEEFKDQHLYSVKGNDEVEKIFDHLIERVTANGQQLFLPNMRPQLTGCRQTESLFIDINGNVAPCDYLAVSTNMYFLGKHQQSKPVIFGNVYQEDPLKIYRSLAFKKFRHQHRAGKNIPEQCRFCIDAYGLMCSHRRVYGKL